MGHVYHLHTLVASSVAFPSILKSFMGLHGRQYLHSAWLCKAVESCEPRKLSTIVTEAQECVCQMGKQLEIRTMHAHELGKHKGIQARSYTLENRMWLQQPINPGDIHSESKAQDRLAFVAVSAGDNLDFLKTPEGNCYKHMQRGVQKEESSNNSIKTRP